MKKICFLPVFLFLMLLAPTRSFAIETASAKDLLFGHIRDQYEWHICEIDGHKIGVPLPVIVYSKQAGLNIFSSERISEEKSYRGFSIAKDGPYANKIVEFMPKSGEYVRPIDISITKNVASLIFSSILLLWIFLGIAGRYKRRPLEKPKGIQAWMEPLILFIQEEVVIPAMPKDYVRFTPYLQTAFFFIFLNNLLGMIPIFPGGANLTGNIAVTIILALITYLLTTFNGTKHYWKEIFWPDDIPLFLKFPIPLYPLIEFFSTLTKPVALAIRLFANVLAGHLMILVMVSLIFIMANMSVWAGAGTSVVSIGFSVFLSLLELLVAFIQAFVFTQLSALFIGLAMEKGHHETQNNNP